MADSGMPWSIKGVSEEARAAAVAAARRAGVPVGVWLSRAIREAADAEAREHAAAGGEAPPP
jgi:hypothetical protein